MFNALKKALCFIAGKIDWTMLLVLLVLGLVLGIFGG